VPLVAANFKAGGLTQYITATFLSGTLTCSGSSETLALGVSRAPRQVGTFKGFKQAIACRAQVVELPRKDFKQERSILPLRPIRARRACGAFRLTRVPKAFRTAKTFKPFRPATFKKPNRAGAFKRTIDLNSQGQAAEVKEAVRAKAKVKDKNSAAYLTGSA